MKKVVYLAEMVFSPADLAKMGPELLSVVSTLAYIANELSVFMGLFISSRKEDGGSEVIEKKWSIQKFTITRAMNARVFEALRSINDSHKILSRSGNKVNAEILKKAVESVGSLCGQPGHRISTSIRNNVTNHYLPSVVRDTLNELGDLQGSSFHIHGSVGDSFYTFGEDYVFVAAFRKIAADLGIPASEAISTWMDWSISATRTVLDAFHDVMTHLIFEALPDKRALRVSPYVRPEYMNVGGERPLALFHSPDSADWFIGKA